MQDKKGQKTKVPQAVAAYGASGDTFAVYFLTLPGSRVESFGRGYSKQDLDDPCIEAAYAMMGKTIVRNNASLVVLKDELLLQRCVLMNDLAGLISSGTSALFLFHNMGYSRGPFFLCTDRRGVALLLNR